ncbi:hypothetical protein GCM10027347_60350 [Larkinella harenae]
MNLTSKVPSGTVFFRLVDEVISKPYLTSKRDLLPRHRQDASNVILQTIAVAWLVALELRGLFAKILQSDGVNSVNI